MNLLISRPRGVWLAAALALTLALGACGPRGDAGPAEGEAPSGDLATLTAAAGGASDDAQSTPDAAAMADQESAADTGDGASTAPDAPGSDGTPTPADVSDLRQELDLPTTVPLPQDGPQLPGGESSDDQINPTEAAVQYDAARQTQEAEAGIIPVEQLEGTLNEQPVLATFTPRPDGPDLDGELIYLRNGSFYRTDASGNEPTELELENQMPRVWAPPDDPGRGWTSPDGEQVAFFAGRNAELWLMDVDGDNNRALSDNNLPTEQQLVTSSDGAEQSVRLMPGFDYTLVRLPEFDTPFAVLIDDNSRHVRGEGRLRVVHAAQGEKDRRILALADGDGVGNTMTYGRGSGNVRVPAGDVNLELWDGSTETHFATLPGFKLGDRELKTVFLYGEDQVRGTQATYQPGETTSGHSRVRVFNATGEPISVEVAGSTTVARDLGTGVLSNYAEVPAQLGTVERRDAQLTIYGNRTSDEPVVWSPDGERIAFLGAPRGEIDLFVTDTDGPARPVTQDARREFNPAWSRDSEHLAWISIDESFDQHELQFLRDGSSQIGRVDAAEIANRSGVSSRDTVRFPDGVGWVDDDRVFFHPVGGRESIGIWTYDTDDGELVQLFDRPVIRPAWSPEAQAWVFVERDSGGTMYRLEPDGDLEVLVEADANYPEWSPDGERISWIEGDPQVPGWRLHVMDADGGNDRALTERLPMLQASPPVPGPDAKRFWLDDGTIAFSRVGRDYGLAERQGPMGDGQAGDDIENLWLVATDGGARPRQASDLTKTFYIQEVKPSPDRDAVGFIGFSYLMRAQQLYTMADEGGKPAHIDGAVRWFTWLR